MNNIVYNKLHIFLLGILIFAFLTRINQLWFPQTYVFDEVYHAFTAIEYTKGSLAAWDPWTTPPSGVAYEWTHPPLAKEIMALSMLLLNSTDSFAWRLPGIILSLISIVLVYKLGHKLFSNQLIGVLAAAVFTLDGLTFVQSRTGMNDIYVLTFLLSSLLAFLYNRFFLSSLLLGLALASKWSAIYIFPLFLIALIWQKKIPQFIFFIIIPPIIYIASYLPYFQLGYTVEQFIELQKQMWWYHTNLKATHDYTSPWWSWPLNLYPVWYYIDYKDDKIANIFASGNIVINIIGISALILTAIDFLKKRTLNLAIILIGYFGFLLPWALSPRIMFLYHYVPSIPFMVIAIAYQMHLLWTPDKKPLVITALIFMLLWFLILYPFLIGIHLPKEFLQLFFYTNITKNPFT